MSDWLLALSFLAGVAASWSVLFWLIDWKADK
jgi:hypothetical protein